MKKLLFLLPILALASCTNSQTTISDTQNTPAPALSEFKLTSPAFKQGEMIPCLYTCDSANVSPELHWTKATGKVVSYALIVADPDAPMGTFIHWVMFNIPAKDTLLPAKFAKDSTMLDGTKQGITSFGNIGYGGPCPPNGTHRYFFKLYALDTTFNLPCATTGQKKLTEAMKGHILIETELMGKYQKINNKQ
jgi:Raf kinase inhibitor-like YbhB/YbcL family protein